MFKVCMIGAGSLGFARCIITDLMSVAEFQNKITISLFDIDETNLMRNHKLILRDMESNGLTTEVIATMDRKEALRDAKYVLNFTRIGGLEAFETDVKIPLKYHVDQAVGDTLCAGGIMYGQRGIAAMMGFCKDIKEVSHPDALLLNYGNPNAMLTWAANHYGKVNCIGLCHGVIHGSYAIAEAFGFPQPELAYTCVGINHQTWFIKLAHNGRPIEKEELIEALTKKYGSHEACRIDMLKRFGYFSTETNGHLSEYLPWYRKRKDDIRNWCSTPMGMNSGETGGYLREQTEGRDKFDNEFDRVWEEGPRKYALGMLSVEHAAWIIRGLECNVLYRGHFNVVNNGVISNIADDAIIEVPGYVDRNGINIPHVGDLPMGCAAVCNRAVDVQRLAVAAAVTGDDELLRQAMMMDPLVGAVCNPPEIWQMTDEMLVAGEKWLPQYTKAIAEAKVRLSDKSKLIPVDEDNKGWVALER